MYYNLWCGGCIIRFGLNVALTHQIRSYRDSETKGNVEVIEKEAERGKGQEEDSDN